MAAVTITNEQKILITLNPTTEAGNPAGIESGSLRLEVLEGDATTEQVGDNSFYAISGEANTLSRIKVTADGDKGEGVVTLEEELILTVIEPNAASLGLNVGTPELK